jgi:hypothetical protein
MNAIKSHILHIDSSQRVNGPSHDFLINLKHPLLLTNKSNFYRVRVLKAIIPNVVKQINSLNKRLYFVVDNVERFIEIEEGNYNINNLLSELKYHLSLDETLSNLNAVFSFIYIKVSGKCMLSSSVPIILKFSTNKILGHMLGFGENDIFLDVAVKSSKHVNVNPINYFLIRCSSLSQRENYENVVEKDVYSDILAKVQIISSPGTFIYYDGNNSYIDVKNGTIDSLNLYLSTNIAYDINLEGLDWSVSLEINEYGTYDSNQLIDNVSTRPNMIPPELVSQIENEKNDLMSQLQNIKSKLIK